MVANNTVSVYFKRMAHVRPRQVDHLFEKLVSFSPIVGIFGHRQTGKTTLAANVCSKYFTLDDRDTRELVSGNPRRFYKDY